MTLFRLIAIALVMPACGAAPLDTSCTGGDGQSCLSTGRRYEARHRGGDVSARSMALRHYERGCQADVADACFAAAAMYRSGSFQKPETALALENRVCEMGDARGCLAVTTTARDAQDYDSSLDAARRTCALDGAQCARALEIIAPHRPAEARALAESTCASGTAATCSKLAIRKFDDATRLLLLQRACEREDWESCSTVATAVQGTEPERAANLYRAACKNGVDSACVIVGELRVSPRSQIDKRTQSWQRECQRGIWKSCEHAGTELLDSDKDRALKLLRIACSHEIETACASLAKAGESGP